MNRLLVAAVAAVAGAAPAFAQGRAAAPPPYVPGALDITIPPSAASNFDHADFRLWVPDGGGPLRAIVVLVPGSNGEGRRMADDTLWQSFATRNRAALVATRFTDKPHEQGFLEDYVQVSRGSGQALLDAIDSLATRAKHPELKTASLFLWGMSAGGQFDYEFTAWKPERVAAFVTNKGGIYYAALVPRAAREVPGLLFIGGKDLESRVATITGLFAVNRRAGALWALTEEPSVGHAVARSAELGAMFFEDVMARRLGPGGNLRALAEKDGWYGDIHLKTITPVGTQRAPAAPTAWLPTERLAKAWLAVVTDTPFEK
jgi:poly(3-hydroxybutyrate) depolymerase